jgi:site-specific DNA-methyltransferase (adenine-specific)
MNFLYKGDCLEVMDKLIENGVKIDAIITDPPYGTTACKWDTVIPFDKMWERLNKLIKPNGAIVLFGSEPFSSALRMSNIKNYKYDWIWEKNKSKCNNFVHANNNPLRQTENISVFSFGSIAHRNKNNNRMEYNPQGLIRIDKKVKEYIRKYTNYPTNIIRYCDLLNTCLTCGEKIKIGESYCSKGCVNLYRERYEFEKMIDKTFHPTQKPVALMEYLIKTYTNENETVLDFTMGSGTTGVACKNLNRNFIGIELDDKYFQIAKERIENN